jgi:hypothetical protein
LYDTDDSFLECGRVQEFFKVAIFCYVALCCPVKIDQHVRGAYCLHYQGDHNVPDDSQLHTSHFENLKYHMAIFVCFCTSHFNIQLNNAEVRGQEGLVVKYPVKLIFCETCEVGPQAVAPSGCKYARNLVLIQLCNKGMNCIILLFNIDHG